MQKILQLVLLIEFLRGVAAVQAATPRLSGWYRLGTNSNENSASLESTAISAREHTYGGEVKWGLGEYGESIFSNDFKGEITQVKSDALVGATLKTFSYSPNYRYWSTDGTMNSQVGYRVSRSLAGRGLGAGTDSLAHQIKYGIQDQFDENWSINFSSRYKLTSYTGSDRTDGFFQLAPEVGYQFISFASLSFEPSFESNASDADSSEYAGIGGTPSLQIFPFDGIFIVLMENVGVKRYSRIGSTDTTYLTLLSSSYALRDYVMITLDATLSKTVGQDASRSSKYWSTQVGMELSY